MIYRVKVILRDRVIFHLELAIELAIALSINNIVKSFRLVILIF